MNGLAPSHIVLQAPRHPVLDGFVGDREIVVRMLGNSHGLRRTDKALFSFTTNVVTVSGRVIIIFFRHFPVANGGSAFCDPTDLDHVHLPRPLMRRINTDLSAVAVPARMQVAAP